MKKILLFVSMGLILVLVAAGLIIGFSLDSLVRKAILTFGPEVTKVDVKLDSVNLSLLSGSGTLKGFVLGNPQGFKTPSAIQVGTASLSLQPRSVLAPKVIIRSIDVQGPEVTFETDLRNNNLSKILSNIEGPAGTSPEPSQPPKETKPGKKLEVDDFRISGGKIHVALTALGQSSGTTVPLPEIHLTDLGTNAEGITAAELSRKVLHVLEQEAAKAASDAINELSKNPGALSHALGTNTTDTINKAAKGLDSLLKKP
jgi:uncharacterized protein involved in outer membrane biogenesis